MPNPVVHWEIHTKEAEKCQEFLAKLFEWHIDKNNPMDYGFVDTHAEGGINGGISPTEGPNQVHDIRRGRRSPGLPGQSGRPWG